MDKELIAMCDCPEIQGKKYWLENGDIICSGTATMRNKKSDRNVRIVQFHDKETGLVSSRNMNRSMDRKGRDYVIYIPRIEDVLEWLGDRFESLRRISQKTRQVGCIGGGNFHRFTGHNDDLKSLLKSFMALDHSKIWEEEAWV